MRRGCAEHRDIEDRPSARENIPQVLYNIEWDKFTSHAAAVDDTMIAVARWHCSYGDPFSGALSLRG